MVYREKKERGITRLTGSSLQAWPVNSVYISFSATNPGLIFGGTWSAIGTGRMLIGVDPSDATMDAAGDVGGAKTHTLTADESPEHIHFSGTLGTNTGGSHNHNVNRRNSTGSGGGVAFGGGTLAADLELSGGSHDHVVSGMTGAVEGTNNQPHNNMPPYLAVYMWRRTA